MGKVMLKRMLVATAWHFLCLSLFVIPASAKSTAQKIRHPPGRFVMIDGARLWYESEGRGEPLLLIAGGPGFSHSYFHPYFSALRSSHRVVYYDAYGCGKSERATPARVNE
jgi:hypothetical protein